MPPSLNIVQKTLFKDYLELAGIKCTRALSFTTLRLIAFDFEKRYKTSGKYILIDMNTSIYF